MTDLIHLADARNARQLHLHFLVLRLVRSCLVQLRPCAIALPLCPITALILFLVSWLRLCRL
ncbi:MAG: hypothetical protein M3Y81_07095 [Chloroflexota bacterium]|nr:hypothetical protein [Chloroflexota bacterium]